MMGLAVGFVQDLFSAGEAGVNLITKGTIGLLAGFTGRHLANATPVVLLAMLLSVSLLSGLVFLLWGWPGEGLMTVVAAVPTVLLPQALYDAVVGAAIYWLMAGRSMEGRDFGGGRVPFGR
jgi:cell shape-determining protein MreD